MNRTAYKTAASAFRRGQRVRYQSKLPWVVAANHHDWEACRAVREAYQRDGSLPPIPRGFARAPSITLDETAPFALARLRDARLSAAGAARMFRQAKRNHAANAEKLKAFPSVVCRGKTIIEHQTLVLAGIKRNADQQRAEHARLVRDLYAKTAGWKRYRHAERVITLRCRQRDAWARLDTLPLAA